MADARNGMDERRSAAERDSRRRRIRALLAEPWQRIGLSVRGVAARLRQPARPGSPPLLPPALWWAAAGACFLILLLLPFDGAINRAMGAEPPGVRVFFGYATDTGLSAWYLYPSAALLLLLSLADWSAFTRAGRVRVANVYAHAAFLLATVAIAASITQILKILFGRARPLLIDEGGSLAFHVLRLPWEYASFPSGHATTMGAVTTALLIWFPALRLPALLVGVPIAISRIVVQDHYASDVAAGFSIGGMTAIVIARWLARRRLFYRFVDGGRGWKGLLPIRFDRARGRGRGVLREVRRGFSRRSLRTRGRA